MAIATSSTSLGPRTNQVIPHVASSLLYLPQPRPRPRLRKVVSRKICLASDLRCWPIITILRREVPRWSVLKFPALRQCQLECFFQPSQGVFVRHHGRRQTIFFFYDVGIIEWLCVSLLVLVFTIFGGTEDLFIRRLRFALQRTLLPDRATNHE